jgi:hypothetical protein
MTKVGFNTFFPKTFDTRFVVRNIAPNGKRVRIFQYPIDNGYTRDLLAIPEVSESDIRHSLLKGTLYIKIACNEIEIVYSNIDLLQFGVDHKAFLESAGVTVGLEAIGVGGLTEEQHKLLRQLVHLADNGPMEGFSGAYRLTRPKNDPFPDTITWYNENSPTKKKIVEKQLTYDSDRRITRIRNIMYDTDGVVVLAIMTDDITYAGTSPFENTRTRTIV